MHGPVYAAGDDGLAAEVATWNVAIQHTPAVAVGATCAADVAAAVSWAVAHDLRVAVQATGHGPVRNAAGSMMITTRRMQGMHDRPRAPHRPRRGRRPVDPGHGGRRRVRPGGAVRVVVRRRRRGLHPRRGHGLARSASTASPPTTSRAVEIVTADGRLRRICADSEPELFWAVRGGKGNLGIVTALEIELVPVTSLFGGGIFFAGEDAPALLHAFREWAPTLPEEVSTSIAILRMPRLEELPPPLRGQTAVHLRFAYAGTDLAEAERLLSPMKTAGTILLGYVGPMRTDEMDAIHMDPNEPMPALGEGDAAARADRGDRRRAAGRRRSAAGHPADHGRDPAHGRGAGPSGEGAERRRRPAAARTRCWSSARRCPELAQVVPAIGKGVLGALAPWKAPSRMINFLGDVTGPEEVAAAYPPASPAAAAGGQAAASTRPASSASATRSDDRPESGLPAT